MRVELWAGNEKRQHTQWRRQWDKAHYAVQIWAALVLTV